MVLPRRGGNRKSENRRLAGRTINYRSHVYCHRAYGVRTRFETFGLNITRTTKEDAIAEIGIRKCDIQGFRMGEMPRAVGTAGGVFWPASHAYLIESALLGGVGFSAQNIGFS